MADLDLEARQATAAAPGDFQMPFQGLDHSSHPQARRWASGLSQAAPQFQGLPSPTKAALETLDLDQGRVQCTVSTGTVKAAAALTYSMTADTLPHLSGVRLWPLEEPHQQASAADQDNSELLAYFEQWGTAKSEPLGQLDLPHHEMAMPDTPNTERILLGASSSAQQSADTAAPSSMPMALMQFPLHSLPEFGGDYEGHGEVVLLPDGFSSSMGSPHFQHQEVTGMSHLPEVSQLRHVAGPRSVQSMPHLPHLYLPDLQPQAAAVSLPEGHAEPIQRRFSQPATVREFSVEDSQSEEEKPARKRRRGARRLTCSNCATHQTPQWRCGPGGPRTLCNACGVRYKKGLPMTGIAAAAAAAAAAAEQPGLHTSDWSSEG